VLEIVWERATVIAWTEILCRSYSQLLGKELLDSSLDAKERAKQLFFAPFVLVSHGTEGDPILNYGNQTALKLWELDWETFTRIPSRRTAEPIDQSARETLLQQVTKQGYIDNYRGVRISSTGRRFEIDRAIVWNLTTTAGEYCGQAATFANWSFLA
jgi:hypothetical protein